MRLLIATGAVAAPGSRDGALIAPLALAKALAARGLAVSLLGRATADPAAGDATPSVIRSDAGDLALYAASDVTEALPVLAAAAECDALLLLGALGGGLARSTRDCCGTRLLWVTDGVAGLAPEPPDGGLALLAGGDAVAAAVAAWTGRRPPCLPSPVVPLDRGRAAGGHVLYLDPRPSAGVEILFQTAAANPTIRFVVLETTPLTEDWRAHCFARARRIGNLDWRAAGEDPIPLIGAARMLLLPALLPDAPAWPVGLAMGAGVPCLVSDQPGLVDALGDGGRVVAARATAADWLTGFAALWPDGPVRRAALGSIAAQALALAPGRTAERLIDHLAAASHPA